MNSLLPTDQYQNALLPERITALPSRTTRTVDMNSTLLILVPAVLAMIGLA